MSIVYNEDCCFNDIRDLCLRTRMARACGCHAPRADHRLESYCSPNKPCPMVHPCHRPGCTVRPELHPR